MTPLVLVHGFMGGADQWHLQAPLGDDRPLITLDLPGFGGNAHLPPIDSIAGFADWMLSQLDSRDITGFDLLGHSMGGMVVQEMVHQAPDRIQRLILYGTGPVGALPGRFEPITTSMARAEKDGAAATARRIAATWFRDFEAHPEYAGCAAIAEKTSLTALLAGLDAMQHWDGVKYLGDIACPTLVMWGDQDRTYPWSQIETLWRGISGCQLAVIPGAAHAVHSERPALLNMILSGFLNPT